MEAKDRLIYLRKEILKMTQEEFAKSIGLKNKATISCYESGKHNINSRTISNICSNHNINEKWLKDGVGEVFKNKEFSFDTLIKSKKLNVMEKDLIKLFVNLKQETRWDILYNLEKYWQTK